MQNPIPYTRHEIREEDIEAVTATLRSDWLTQGPQVQRFEKDFAAYIGVNYAVAVSSGTAALHLSALALGVKPDSKVITTPITFAASANCIQYCGGEIDFCDIDPETYLLDLSALEKKLQSAPAGTYQGIIPVDFMGYPLNLEALRALADTYGLWILEDACHAPGGAFLDSNNHWQRCGNGNFAELAIFSLHPAKHIAAGEGGVITTNSTHLYEKLLRLRTHGMTKNPEQLQENHGGWYYEIQELGYNYRFPDILAALAHSQLQAVAPRLHKRQEIAARYDTAFRDSLIQAAPHAEGIQHAYHLYVIQTPQRKKLYDSLLKKRIQTQVHYIPVHLQPYYRNKGWKEGDFPMAEAYYQNCLSIPMYPSLSKEEQNFVIQSIFENLNPDQMD